MGLLDWIFKRTRGPAESASDDVPVAPPARTERVKPKPEKRSAKAPQQAKAAQPAKERKPATERTEPKKERTEPKKERTEPKKKRKQRKGGEAEASAPRSEVLSAEEARRRYGALFEPKVEAPVAPTLSQDPPAFAPPEADLPLEPPPPVAVSTLVESRDPAPTAPTPTAPARARPKRKVDERDAYRAWTIVPQLEALLARADKAAADTEATATSLRAAKKKLLLDWEALGAPPEDQEKALLEARRARVTRIEARLAELAKADDLVQDGLVSQRKEILLRGAAVVEGTDLKAARAALQALEAEWRAAPKVDVRHQKPLRAEWDRLWKRLNERSDAVRAEQGALHADRLEQQRRLIEQAEALAKVSDVQQAAERMKGLQATWKTVGFAGKSAEAEASWQRFRGAADAIFLRRNEALDAEARANVEKKEALIERARALAEEGVLDPDPVLDELHRAWKKIGHVPKKASDDLWAAFREACNQLRTPPSIPGDVLGDQGSLRFNPFADLGKQPDPTKKDDDQS